VVWNFKELDILEAQVLDPSKEKIPSRLSPTFFSRNTDRQYGFGTTNDGKKAFHFVSREDVPLVIIPLKDQGHILLSLKEPDQFISALLTSAIQTNKA
jgi:hypothetical protein